MFKTIRTISDLGVFSAFAPAEGNLPEFAPRNLIYGWNYSGKTTLSRVFRSFERGRLHPDFANASFSLALDDGTPCSEQTLTAIPFPVRVFNADFVRDNLRWEDGVEPILVMGEENISLQDEMVRLDGWVERRTAFRDELRRRRQQISTDLEQAGTQTARIVRESLGRSPFNRRPHLQAVVDELGSSFENHVLKADQHRTETKKLNAEKREPVLSVPSYNSISHLWEEVTALVGRTARQEVVERLRGEPTLANWVQSGIQFHEDSATCLFCDQKLPPSLLEVLGRHFSDAFRALQRETHSLLTSVKDQVPSFNPPSNTSLYPDLQQNFQMEVDECTLLVPAAAEDVSRIKGCLEAKLEDPTAVLQPPKAPADPDRKVLNLKIAELNVILEEHNKRCRDFEAQRTEAQNKLIRHAAAVFMQDQDYSVRLEEDQDLQLREHRVEDRIGHIVARQAEIRSKLGEEGGGADLINRHLRQAFGTDEIRVEVTADKTYTLRRRNGHLARNLSEGEKTAIAFSYFLASLKERSLGDQPPVVYIDDPISSLDGNHLFGTFAAIKSICADCRQLFVSTHNFGFFRLMKSDAFFKEVVREKRRASWYLVRRNSVVAAELTNLPTSLRRFNSEYHYLFDLAHRFDRDPGGNQDLLGLMPNILRRILEIYSSFRIPDTGRNLFQRLELLDPDQEARRNTVYKFVNHGSHSDSMELGVEFPQSEECGRVVRLVFEILLEKDSDHFEGMCGIVAPTEEGAERQGFDGKGA